MKLNELLALVRKIEEEIVVKEEKYNKLHDNLKCLRENKRHLESRFINYPYLAKALQMKRE
jgi:hypothetical protein